MAEVSFPAGSGSDDAELPDGIAGSPPGMVLGPGGDGRSTRTAVAAPVPAAASARVPVPLVPRYGAGALCDVLPSAAAALGVPGFTNPLELPPARGICVLLVDGFGWTLLHRAAGSAPLLIELADGGAPITAGFPATTATSLASLGTGLPPGAHGLLGCQVTVPGTGRLLNLLHWDDSVDPLDWQPHPTVWERLAGQGVDGYHVAPGAFRGSGLTRAGMRGARYVPVETGGDLVAQTAEVARGQARTLIFAYYSYLDKTGHRRGCDSEAWSHELALVDRLVERLLAALPADFLLMVTGDHGMVDVQPADRIDADTHPHLLTGVALLAGDPRARHVHAVPGAVDDVLATWREVLGDRMWVVPRAEAVESGWFGPTVSPHLLGRIGDVLAASFDHSAVTRSVAERRLSELVGQHGSLTADEQLVPLLRASGTLR